MLAVAELNAARLDGELYAIDEAFAPVDEVDDARLRAAALLELIGTRLIAELDSALWIHGILSLPPALHRVCVSRSDRLKFAPSPRFVVREVTHGPYDIEGVGELRVTTPARILFDLSVLGGDEAARHAAALIQRWPHLAAECVERIDEAPNLPGKIAALARLREWMAEAGESRQPVLTRYTS
ncbi:hypothetical protein GCM10027568_08330 [Humibacter soli]